MILGLTKSATLIHFGLYDYFDVTSNLVGPMYKIHEIDKRIDSSLKYGSTVFKMYNISNLCDVLKIHEAAVVEWIG